MEHLDKDATWIVVDLGGMDEPYRQRMLQFIRGIETSPPGRITYIR